MKETKLKWFLPFRYAAPADLEEYLEKMDLEGWHIDRIRQSDSVLMRFKRSRPQKNRYVVDLCAFPKSDYVTTYKSFGWELAGKMASMYVWRMPYTVQRPEAFSTPESINERSDNIARVMSALIGFIILILIGITIAFFIQKGWLAADGWLGLIITIGCSAVLILTLYIARRQVLKNRHR
jgi:hypothetical protein